MKDKLLIEIGHPAHIHQFRNLFFKLIENDWEVLFAVKDKDIVLELANRYNLPYEIIGKTKKGFFKKIIDLPLSLLNFFFIAKKFNPDLIISRLSPLSSCISYILGVPHLSFADTEPGYKLHRFTLPLVDYVFTSTSFKRDYGEEKHYRYLGSHELAYLHPNYFEPSNEIFNYLGIEENEKYAIIRFVAWEAFHDVGEYGLTEDQKEEIVTKLAKHMHVFISSEKGLPDSLKKYTIDIPSDLMHDALSHATLQIGESPTMAEEAATLGVPSICISSWASEAGVIQDLVDSGLLVSLHPDEYNKLVDILEMFVSDENIKAKWRKKREEYLKEKIDVTSFYFWLINNYPDSIRVIKENSEYEKRFIDNE
ncbi:DUF354 domain-containing protein [Fodinibius sp. AD559]|uniref:DUF354 domain-containing protein n=1 Tax=Fodinibius sp. AD559 TaxID=3424179 RepID=UPI004046D79A